MSGNPKQQDESPNSDDSDDETHSGKQDNDASLPLQYPGAFLEKLALMLDYETSSGGKTVKWLNDGTGFVIYDQNSFEKEVIPRHFSRRCMFQSFVRKLYRFGFRQTDGSSNGRYIFESDIFNRSAFGSISEPASARGPPSGDSQGKSSVKRGDGNVSGASASASSSSVPARLDQVSTGAHGETQESPNVASLTNRKGNHPKNNRAIVTGEGSEGAAARARRTEVQLNHQNVDGVRSDSHSVHEESVLNSLGWESMMGQITNSNASVNVQNPPSLESNRMQEGVRQGNEDEAATQILNAIQSYSERRNLNLDAAASSQRQGDSDANVSNNMFGILQNVLERRYGGESSLGSYLPTTNLPVGVSTTNIGQMENRALSGPHSETILAAIGQLLQRNDNNIQTNNAALPHRSISSLLSNTMSTNQNVTQQSHSIQSRMMPSITTQTASSQNYNTRVVAPNQFSSSDSLVSNLRLSLSDVQVRVHESVRNTPSMSQEDRARLLQEMRGILSLYARTERASDAIETLVDDLTFPTRENIHPIQDPSRAAAARGIELNVDVLRQIDDEIERRLLRIQYMRRFIRFSAHNQTFSGFPNELNVLSNNPAVDVNLRNAASDQNESAGIINEALQETDASAQQYPPPSLTPTGTQTQQRSSSGETMPYHGNEHEEAHSKSQQRRR